MFLWSGRWCQTLPPRQPVMGFLSFLFSPSGRSRLSFPCQRGHSDHPVWLFCALCLCLSPGVPVGKHEPVVPRLSVAPPPHGVLFGDRFSPNLCEPMTDVVTVTQPCFTAEDVETQLGAATCPRAHRNRVASQSSCPTRRATCLFLHPALGEPGFYTL